MIKMINSTNWVTYLCALGIMAGALWYHDIPAAIIGGAMYIAASNK